MVTLQGFLEVFKAAHDSARLLFSIHRTPVFDG